MANKTKKVPVRKKKSAAKRKSVRKSLSKATETIAPLASLREEVDNLFDRFSDDWPSLPNLFGRGWSYPVADLERRFSLPKFELTPRVDVSENDQEYDIMMELPGMTGDDIEITLSGDSVTVKGEKQNDREEKKENFHIKERSYGSFQRSFRIPSGVDHDLINASCEHGILNVSLPKTENAKNSKRSINVKTAD
jgi:HSP20 family protein